MKTKTTAKIKNHSGGIALYLIVSLSILFIVATVAATQATISEVRQSSDVSRSDQAFYAAEAGVEEAIQRLNKYPDASIEDLFPEQFTSAAQPGDKALLVDSDGDVLQNFNINREDSSEQNGLLSWRNRRVTDADIRLFGRQVKDETIQVDTSHLRRRSGGGVMCANTEYDPNECDQRVGEAAIYNQFRGIQYCFSSEFNPEIEYTIVSWPSDSPQDSEVEKYITRNSSVSGNHVDLDYLPGPDGKDCIEITRNSSWQRRFLFRIKPIFTGVAEGADHNAFSVDYDIDFIDSGLSEVFIPNNAVLIDVTGQSADIRRRLVVKKRRNGSIIGVFDFAVYSGDREAPLCKAGVQQSDVGYDGCAVIFSP